MGSASAMSARLQMVQTQIRGRGVRDPRVLMAMESVPRHRFLPPERRSLAYEDRAVALGERQTISQPYIVGLMSEVLQLTGDERVLEIGTGSGYQTAVLAELAGEVYSIEILPPLAAGARKLLGALGYENVHLREGDGSLGWPEQAPFDCILSAAAPATIPPAFLEQLAEGGRLILPVGSHQQELQLISKVEGKIHIRSILPVRFVPMTGAGPGQRSASS